MSDVTQILVAIGNGDAKASAELLPVVYDELRRLARARMANEHAGHTLQPTALVHEAYLRLVDVEQPQRWQNRGHFFAAAAEAMRRILVENARHKGRQKHGGDRQRIQLDELDLTTTTTDDRLIAIDEALERLAQEEPQAVELVKLRFFAGFSITEAGELLGLSRTVAYEQWAYARAWLQCEIEK
jgi:RNA polymerase sigma factor (TIGR02999 family)